MCGKEKAVRNCAEEAWSCKKVCSFSSLKQSKLNQNAVERFVPY